MQRVTRSAVIDAPIERVWEVLRDFNSHDRWHPAVAESHIENGEASDQVVNSALRYRAQAPLIDELLREIGIDSGKSGPALATGLLKGASKVSKPEGSGS